MKTKQNFSVDKEVAEELARVNKATKIAKSVILNMTLKFGLEDIKKLNYNFTQYIREREVK